MRQSGEGNIVIEVTDSGESATEPVLRGGDEPELRARARDGCAVVVATASLRDAGDVADAHVLLRGGTVAGTAGSLDELAAFTPS